MVTASIVTYHTDPSELTDCLACLSAPAVGRIYVVDNSSSPAISQLVSGNDKVQYIAAQNRGYGAGHNIALRQAMSDGADYHLVLNSDVSFEPYAIEQMVDFMERNAHVGMLQPRILNPDGSDQYTVRLLPSPIDMAARLLPYALRRSRTDRYELRLLDRDKIWNVCYHQGSFMLLRTDALRQTGLFDERYFMYPEDIDLTRRVHEKYATLYYPTVTITHYHRATSKHNLKMFSIHIANMVRYFNKWGWWHDVGRKEINRRVLQQKIDGGYCNFEN